MNRKVQAYLKSMEMIQPGDHVICAVSGGKDSMSMLHGLCALAAQMDFTISAAHMNHQLRGAESQRDAAFVADYCQGRGISVQLGTADVSAYAAEHGMGIEEAARTLRYEFLLGLDPNAKIATAHTADDNFETVLMHMLRGCGLHGLAGIPPVRGRIIRPLLCVSRREIETYLEQYQIPHVEDSTNALDDQLRNRVRHFLVPWFIKENPSFLDTFTKLVHAIRLDDDFLAQEADARLRDAAHDGTLSLENLRSQHEAMQIRMLRKFLFPIQNMSYRQLKAAYRLCHGDNPAGKLSLPGGYTLRRSYSQLSLLPPTSEPEPPAAIFIAEPGVYRFGPWEVTCTAGPAPAVFPQDTIALAASRLTGPLCLRPYQPGDRICLSGGTKKLSDLFIDRKIPVHMRPHMPVAVVDDVIAAVLPLRAAKSFSPAPGEDCMLLRAEKREV